MNNDTGQFTNTSSAVYFSSFRRGDISIGAQDVRWCGKRPSLFIRKGNMSYKVASFSSVEAAQDFTDAMIELLGLDEAK